PYCDHIAEAVEAIHYCAGNCNGCGTTNDEVASCGVYRTTIDPLREINFHFGWRTTRGADAVSKDRFGSAEYERSLFTCGDGTIAMVEYRIAVGARIDDEIMISIRERRGEREHYLIGVETV